MLYIHRKKQIETSQDMQRLFQDQENSEDKTKQKGNKKFKPQPKVVIRNQLNNTKMEKKGQKPSFVGLFQSKETSSPSSSLSRKKNINAIKKEATFFFLVVVVAKK